MQVCMRWIIFWCLCFSDSLSIVGHPLNEYKLVPHCMIPIWKPLCYSPTATQLRSSFAMCVPSSFYLSPKTPSKFRIVSDLPVILVDFMSRKPDLSSCRIGGAYPRIHSAALNYRAARLQIHCSCANCMWRFIRKSEGNETVTVVACSLAVPCLLV